jgi:hypothetical protein
MGRRRRTSNSTVGSIDNGDITWLKETQFLKPTSMLYNDAGIETYDLDDAIIYDKYGRPASLFDVDCRGPFIARGEAKADNTNMHMLVKRSVKSAYIEVNPSHQCCIGKAEDGRPLIYAQGTAGWYEISPNAEYAEIDRKMREGIMLYYYLLDIYEERTAGKKKPHVKMSDAFFKVSLQPTISSPFVRPFN